MYCSKCGQELNERDTFCSACGEKIDNVPNESKENKKNSGILFLIISVCVQIISLIGSTVSGFFGAFMFAVCLCSTLLVLILGIVCIVKSNKTKKHKGKVLGIICATLSGIAIVTISLGVLFGNYTARKTNIEIQKTADEAIEILEECLKSPRSLYVNSVVVEVKSSKTEVIIDGVKQNEDEPFDGTYTVYIDYSAENSFGGTTRSYFEVSYYILGTEKTLLAAKEISSIPPYKGTIYEIDKSRFN